MPIRSAIPQFSMDGQERTMLFPIHAYKAIKV